MQPSSAHLAQIGALPLSELIGCRVGFGQHRLDLWRDQMLMRDQAQSRELLGARGRPAIGHDCGGIPVENRDCLLDRPDLSEPLLPARDRRSSHSRVAAMVKDIDDDNATASENHVMAYCR